MGKRKALGKRRGSYLSLRERDIARARKNARHAELLLAEGRWPVATAPRRPDRRVETVTIDFGELSRTAIMDLYVSGGPESVRQYRAYREQIERETKGGKRGPA